MPRYQSKRIQGQMNPLVSKTWIQDVLRSAFHERRLAQGPERHPYPANQECAGRAADHVPEEFQKRLNRDPELAQAFRALTPGRQKGYLLHFAAAKQAATRDARVQKQARRILKGLGPDD